MNSLGQFGSGGIIQSNVTCTNVIYMIYMSVTNVICVSDVCHSFSVTREIFSGDNVSGLFARR